MSLPITEGFSRVGTGTPNAIVAFVPGMSFENSLRMATWATLIAQEWMPKVSGSAARSLRPVAAQGYYGVSWGRSYVRHLEKGTNPFTMRSLAGKTIPMWISDDDGTIAATIPAKDLSRRTRVTEDGRKQVKIFRKAAPIGSRKWVKRNGQMVSVPRSYPGAPGRINRRDDQGRINRGNVGVRWRHPGNQKRDYIGDALDYVAHSVHLHRVHKQEVSVPRHAID